MKASKAKARSTKAALTEVAQYAKGAAGGLSVNSIKNLSQLLSGLTKAVKKATKLKRKTFKADKRKAIAAQAASEEALLHGE